MNITRFYEASSGLDIVQVMPGTLYVADAGECITTILGSCIAVCLIDPVHHVGGLNHFMLPGVDDGSDAPADSNNYGSYAMNQLVTSMQAKGANTKQCEAKIFGGGCMFPNEQDIGARNIEFTTQYLLDHNIPITGKDVGLSYSRRVRFYTDSGKVMVKRLRSLHNKHVSKQENEYGSGISTRSTLADDAKSTLPR